MKKIARILPFLFGCILCAFALSACAGGAASSSSSSSSGSSGTTEGANAASSQASTTSTTPISGENALVVYYSASGNTARVATEIAAAAGADTFEITPVEAYTEEDLDWTQEGSRVNREHDDESLRVVDLTTTNVPNWDSYDTVFIGYPIWWAVAAWPVDGFVSANDFTGKTVVPFCTSTSSGIGQSAELLAQLAGTGDWQPGMRFSSNASQSEVDEWVSSLGL